MKHYTGTIPVSLAEKLKAAGMPITMSNHLHQIAPDVRGVVLSNFKEIDRPMFCEVFDWLMSNRRITIVVEPSFYEPYLGKVYNKDGFVKGFDGKTWHEAANAAIEKALTL